jgi:signal peptidase I
VSIRSANLGLFKIRTINNMQEREIMGKSRRERKRQRERENRIDWLKSVLSASAAALIVVQFVIPTAVYGRSMEPGFEHRDYLLIHKQAYVGEAEPERGDVIVFQSKLRDNNRGTLKKLIKRVIGVPGDIVEIREGKVYINGEELKERYIKDGVTNGDVGPVVVPEGNYFCMGDNRLHSTDSRFLEVGFVEKDKIVGKVVFRLYPFSKFGMIGSTQ